MVKKKTPPAKAKLGMKKPRPEMRGFFACEFAGRLAGPPPLGDKTTLNGMFDTIFATGVPAVFSQFYVFLQFQGGSGKYMVHMIAVDNHGNKITESQPLQMTMKSGETSDVFVQLVSIPVMTFGDIKFSAVLDGITIGWPLILHVKKVP